MEGTFDLLQHYKPVRYQALDMPISDMHRFVERYQLDLNPDYQRGHVWTSQQESLFAGHILEGGDTSRILINRVGKSELGHNEVVDGKQRLTALLNWLDNKVPAIFTDGTKAFHRDLSAVSLRILSGLSLTLPIGRLYITRPEVLDLYVRLNRGGTVHSDDEIRKVRELLELERGKSNDSL